MNLSAAPKSIKYIAEIHNAQETTLIGRASLHYWRAHLAQHRLHPASRDGQAEVVISAVALRWLGLRFRELSVSVSVCREESGVTRDGFYLVSAFNTSRLLAWCERRMFRTPYVHASIEVQAQPQCSLKLGEATQTLLSAERRAAGPTVRSDEDVWEVSIYLPSAAPGELFYARLGGMTEVYPFEPAADVVRFNPSAAHPVVHQLVESKFVGMEWRVRPNAHHARSKTFPRSA